jgi:hypothetical protein
MLVMVLLSSREHRDEAVIAHVKALALERLQQRATKIHVRFQLPADLTRLIQNTKAILRDWSRRSG